MNTKKHLMLSGLTLALLAAACTDVQISVPEDKTGYRYDLVALSEASELQSATLYLVPDEFSVKPSLITPHEYTGTYNGCAQIEALFDGEHAILFSFTNWSIDEDGLTVLLNWTPAEDASLLLSNNDGGKIEATLSTTTAEGAARQILFRAKSPAPDSGSYCSQQANVA